MGCGASKPAETRSQSAQRVRTEMSNAKSASSAPAQTTPASNAATTGASGGEETSQVSDVGEIAVAMHEKDGEKEEEKEKEDEAEEETKDAGDDEPEDDDKEGEKGIESATPHSKRRSTVGHMDESFSKAASEVANAETVEEAEEGDEDPEVVVGYVEKKGEGRMAAWKRRFIVLDGGILSYFGSESDYDAKKPPNRRRAIDLRKYAILSGPAPDNDGRGFYLQPIESTPTSGVVKASGGGARVFQFRALKAADRDAWIATFEGEGCLSKNEYENKDKKDEEAPGAAADAAPEKEENEAAEGAAPVSTPEKAKEGDEEEEVDDAKPHDAGNGSKTGYLEKLGAKSGLLGKRRWQRRFVVVRDRHMSYYEKSTDFGVGKAPIKKNFVELSKYEVVAAPATRGDGGFGILLRPRVDSSARLWEFRAPDEDTRSAWIETFVAAGAARGEQRDTDAAEAAKAAEAADEEEEEEQAEEQTEEKTQEAEAAPAE